MILMDADHLTVLKYTDSARYARLTGRLATAVPELIGTTAVNVEEQMRGWLASIAKEKNVLRHVSPYRELTALFEFFAGLYVAPFTVEAAIKFQEFRSAGVRISTSDLKAACVAIAHNALLLTANKRDFEKVPGLRFENWLD